MGIFKALALIAVMIPLAALPSSSVALVVARSVSSGRINGAFAALGIVAGDLVFVAMALLGMAVLAEQLGALFAVLKYVGGAYLIYLGINLLGSRPSLSVNRDKPSHKTLFADFLAGFVLTLGDIKTIFFYASLFPALIDVEQVGLREVLIIVAVTSLAVGGVKLVYVAFASQIAGQLRNKVSSAVPRNLGGVLMIGCGSALIAKA